jgi:hypothetical protein
MLKSASQAAQVSRWIENKLKARRDQPVASRHCSLAVASL